MNVKNAARRAGFGGTPSNKKLTPKTETKTIEENADDILRKHLMHFYCFAQCQEQALELYRLLSPTAILRLRGKTE